MTNKTKSISRKLISIIVIAMIAMAIAIAAVIGVSGYANLESITRDNIDRSVNVIAERIASLPVKSHGIIDSINRLEDVQDLLITESTLSPYYHEQSSEVLPIDEADQIYKLQAQLDLANLLRPIMLARESRSLTLYHVDSFSLGSQSDPAFSMRLTDDALELAQYRYKSRDSMVASIIEGGDQYSYANLFDISSIYELNLNDFLAKMNVKPLYAVPESPSVESRGWIDRLITVDNKPIIQTAARINITMPHPDDWVNTETNAYIIVIEQDISETQIMELKELVNADIALMVEGELLISTLDTAEFTYDPSRKVVFALEEYFVATKKITFSAEMGELREMEVLVLSPTSTVARLNFQLFIQVFVVILCSTLLVCILLYLVIARVISVPLTGLLRAVEHLTQGELVNKINIESNNEIGRLAIAFNQMSANVHEKRNQLKVSNRELEQLLEMQREEIESVQTQLIEAEKMSSLGELVAGVSHEVSTPIGICITAESFFHDETHLIQKKFNDGSMSRQDFTDYMQTALENGSILSANLGRTAVLIKNFKQIAVDQCIEDIRSISVCGYIENLLSTLKPRIKSLKHKIVISGERHTEIVTYPGAIAQIITNLVMNSILHGFDEIDEGTISIDIDSGEQGVNIVYRDDGKGMLAQEQEKIFDPFFTTRKGKGGTGLGMNIVYKLITDTLHGHIECSSQPGQGVRFNIFIGDQQV
jgi:signal transduction histidine kinase